MALQYGDDRYVVREVRWVAGVGDVPRRCLVVYGCGTQNGLPW